jgi:hypothetical protein
VYIIEHFSTMTFYILNVRKGIFYKENPGHNVYQMENGVLKFQCVNHYLNVIHFNFGFHLDIVNDASYINYSN